MREPLVNFQNLTPKQEYRFAEFLRLYLQTRFEHFVATNLKQLRNIRLYEGDSAQVTWSLHLKATEWTRLLHSDEPVRDIILDAELTWERNE